MKTSRRDHAPAFKAKVALEATCKESTVTEVSRKYGVHANQVRTWTEQLLAGAVASFASGGEVQRDQEDVVKDLHAKIGKLSVERDLLFKALER